MIKLFKFLLRLFPGLFSIYAGMWKLGGQFINSTVKLEDIKDCASTKMVFLFYHSSGNYVYVIAMTQIIGGLLLIYKKTSIIGAVICLTVFVNVMLLDYYFHFAKGLVIIVGLLNLSFVLTLVFEHKRLKQILITKE